MSLQEEYPAMFLQLFDPYPKWPVGRTKKHRSYQAFVRAHRVLKFTAADIEAIVRNIKARIEDCATWQKGSRFGPPSLEVFINQRLWAEPYEAVRRQPLSSSAQDFAPDVAGPRASEEAVRRAIAQMKRELRH